MAPRKIRRQLVIYLQASSLHEIRGLTFAAEAVGFELDERGKSEGVVAGHEVHVLLADPSHAKQAIATVVASHVMNLWAGIIPGGVGCHRATCAAHDEHRRLAEIIGTLTRGDDHRRRYIRLQATVEQAERLHHPA